MAILLLAGVAVLPPEAAAQGTRDTLSGLVWTRPVKQRWIIGAVPDSSVKWIDSRNTIRIESVTAEGGSRTFKIAVPAVGGSFTLSAAGRVTGFNAARMPSARQATQLGGRDTLRFQLFELQSAEMLLSLPAFRLLDVALSFPVGQMHAGGRWTDSISHDQSVGPYRQSIFGQRVSVVTSDSTIDGRHLFIIVDTARVRYAEVFPSEELITGKAVMMDRRASGTITGRSVFDPVLRTFVTRVDSTALTGTQTKRFPDGGVLSVPARYQRISSYILEDSTASRARATAASQRMPLAEAQAAAALRNRPVSEFLARGDTFGAVNAVTRGSIRIIDVPMAQLIIALIADPKLAARYNTNMQYLIGDAYGRMLNNIPAITADTSKWGCVPAACAILARQWETAKDARLRELGLVAHLVMDPKRWADTARAHAEVDPAYADVLTLVRGVGAPWPAAAKLPLPSTSATWADWEQWMNGLDPSYRQQKLGVRDTLNRAHPGVRFNPSHLTALRFQSLVTGRDFAAEFSRAFDSATNDTARMVYRTMLIGLGVTGGDPEGMRSRFLNGSDVEKQTASREITAMLDRAPVVRTAETDSLTDALLKTLFDGTPFEAMAGQRTLNRITPRPGDSVFIVLPGASRVLQDRWSSRAKVVVDSTWRAPSEQFPVSVYRVFETKLTGNFASIRYEYSYRSPGAGGAPSRGAFATGGTIYLVRVPGGWTFVNGMLWIT